MFDYYYNIILPKYGYENVKLIFTDTDSLCLQIKSKSNIYRDMVNDS